MGTDRPTDGQTERSFALTYGLIQYTFILTLAPQQKHRKQKHHTHTQKKSETKSIQSSTVSLNI